MYSMFYNTCLIRGGWKKLSFLFTELIKKKKQKYYTYMKTYLHNSRA